MIHGALLPSIRVECRLAPDLLPVECDPTQVCQVLLNLLVNACEAMEGGGTLTVKTENVVFASEWFGSAGESVPAGEYVHIVLSDTGAGMPDDIRRRIFEPFFTTKFMGRGLGLAAALGIMRNHQGGVLVESQPGQGTIFHLHFPRTHSILEPATPVVEQPLQYTGTVLVVDDEEVVREVALRMLQKMGFEVLLAESGRQALEIFEASSGRIRLVILDIQMAGMGGAEVFARMREINANVQVVVSSGYDEAAMAEFPSSECLAGFIKKPYTLAALREAVDEAIQAS
jgi:CheY-like chemotaxis protein